ncbi:unnamed protein product [Microthlaspi erraticum]|uniref:Uncharacterized protein n=1 Tax=Microthlaspi erraticum TaxID=1685480 RepID=A0A6D2HCI0_9BRAS|nr:unnamed protein product [Microthlaspi erraticum]
MVDYVSSDHIYGVVGKSSSGVDGENLFHVAELMTMGLTGLTAAVARYRAVQSGIERFKAVVVIVINRRKPLRTANAAFAGGSGRTNQTANAISSQI